MLTDKSWLSTYIFFRYAFVLKAKSSIKKIIIPNRDAVILWKKIF